QCILVFVQAADGIRDFHVTGVQTCALPISPGAAVLLAGRRATVEIRLDREGAGRTALAPVDAFNRLEVDLDPAPSLTSVRVTPQIGRASGRERVEGSGAAEGFNSTSQPRRH